MRTARLAVSAAATLVSLAFAAAALAVAPRYSGKTSQKTSVVLRLAPGERRIAVLRIHYRIRCDDHSAAHQTYTEIFNLPMTGGRFTGTGIYKGSKDGSMDEYRVAGRVRASGASGSFRWRASVSRSGHTVHCASGPITWSARRAAPLR